jgi:hypothetical protein
MVCVVPLLECHDGMPPKIESYAMHEGDSMRTLEIPEKTFFWNGRNFTVNLYNRSARPAMLRLHEVGEINSLNMPLPNTRYTQPPVLRL